MLLVLMYSKLKGIKLTIDNMISSERWMLK